MKLFNKLSLLIIVYGCLIVISMLSSYSSSEMSMMSTKEGEMLSSTTGEGSEEGLNKLDKKRKHKKTGKALKTRKVKTRLAPPLEPFANTSLQNNTYRDMNYTFVKRDLRDFKENNKRWDYKLLDKQLEDIFRTLNERNLPFNTVFSDRAYMEIFMNYFAACDTNHDQVLQYSEFTKCMRNDTYLQRIAPPPKIYAAQMNYTNPEFFLNKIFEIMDSYHVGYLNFHAYMELRLMIFSWRKCSVVGPFIEETSWECAIEIVSGMKTMSRPTLRNTYLMCLEISNSWNVRNIDFISYLYFASSARLYGRINGKGDGDVTSKRFI